MRVREYVTRESMELFLRGQARNYSDVRCPRSIAARVRGVKTRSCGVLVLVDAAHSFLSVLGLGLNSALMDVGVLARVLDEATA